MNPMQEWLDEYSKPKVKKVMKSRFLKYLTWSKKTPQELVTEFDNRKARSEILHFQSYLIAEGFKPNTVRSLVNAVRSFYTSQCESVRGLKRKVVAIQQAKGEHVFSLKDLREMFTIGKTRDKAILSVATSLGWEVSAILDMERDYFESLVKRAKSQKQQFISFNWQRKKTNATQFGILNPLALEWLGKYLEATKDKPSVKLWNGLISDSMNDIIKRLTKEANVQTTGRIRFHLIRKWLMQTLSSNGFNSFEVKLIMGKAISVSDLTYLQQLKDSCLEKYKNIYAFNLALNGHLAQVQHDSVTKAVITFVQALKNAGVLKKVNPQDLAEVEKLLGITEEANGNEKQEEPQNEA